MSDIGEETEGLIQKNKSEPSIVQVCFTSYQSWAVGD